MNVHGNPYKLPQADRGKWAEGLDLEPYEGQEHLLFIGCVGAYDERGQKIARAVASLLKDWQVSFGILGSEEHCDGNEVKCLGERGLFGQMAQENIRAFQEASVKNIITLSPHAFHALKEEYPKLGGDFQVYHYSQILGRLISKIDFKVKQRTLRVTYHDPCYLGRHQKEYKAPRRVLRALRGVQFTEMGRAEANALCCGGGGGNFFTDVLGTGPDSPARVRVREALETGAEIIAVACPNCAKMLEDAVKAEFLEDNLAVMDLAELVQLP
jgi:Fe-S oxidoreductase